jgi:hypothetical protein
MRRRREPPSGVCLALIVVAGCASHSSIRVDCTKTDAGNNDSGLGATGTAFQQFCLEQSGKLLTQKARCAGGDPQFWERIEYGRGGAAASCAKQAAEVDQGLFAFQDQMVPACPSPQSVPGVSAHGRSLAREAHFSVCKLSCGGWAPQPKASTGDTLASVALAGGRRLSTAIIAQPEHVLGRLNVGSKALYWRVSGGARSQNKTCSFE